MNEVSKPPINTSNVTLSEIGNLSCAHVVHGGCHCMLMALYKSYIVILYFPGLTTNTGDVTLHPVRGTYNFRVNAMQSNASRYSFSPQWRARERQCELIFSSKKQTKKHSSEGSRTLNPTVRESTGYRLS